MLILRQRLRLLTSKTLREHEVQPKRTTEQNKKRGRGGWERKTQREKVCVATRNTPDNIQQKPDEKVRVKLTPTFSPGTLPYNDKTLK